MPRRYGGLAQLGEHLPYKQGVGGSIPSSSTIYFDLNGPVVQLVRMPACHAGGRGFESRPDRHFTYIVKGKAEKQGLSQYVSITYFK